MERVYKTTRITIEHISGHYLVLAGSNSIWAGFRSKKHAETCLDVLPGWKYHYRK